MRKRWLGLVLGLLVLATAPGCRVVAGAALLVGEAVIEGALDDDDDACDPAPRHEHRAARPSPRRHAERPLSDPCR